MRVCASIETEPWSSAVRSAETVAAGEPSTRVTDPRTSTASTSATWPSGRTPTVPATGICRRPSTESTPGVIDAERRLDGRAVLERVGPDRLTHEHAADRGGRPARSTSR